MVRPHAHASYPSKSCYNIAISKTTAIGYNVGKLVGYLLLAPICLVVGTSMILRLSCV